ncbi:MAG: Uma2 family endonuclease [Bryobacteraceae bacterium]|jgi:Uma2 family endonuclease
MAVATLVPTDEYLSTSWDPDREYLAGRLIERNPGELDHSYLQYLMAKLLDRRGLLPFVELRVQVRANRFRIPDVLAIRGARPSGRFLRQAPYIVIEILSRDDRAGDIDDKIDDYLELEVENIWVIDPRRLRVGIRTGDGSRICRETVETLDGELSIALSEIFADMQSTEDQ